MNRFGGVAAASSKMHCAKIRENTTYRSSLRSFLPVMSNLARVAASTREELSRSTLSAILTDNLTSPALKTRM